MEGWLEWAWWIWALLLYALGTLVAIDALWQGRTAQGTIAWFLALLLVPFVALPLYALFGSRRFHGYVRARRHGHQNLDRLLSQVLQQLKPYKATSTRLSEPLLPLFRLPLLNGNQVQLLSSGQAFYERMFAAIEAASLFVCVQFYILRSDSTGQKLAELLIRKAQAGVKVYVLYDEIGSSGLSKLYVFKLKQAGVLISRFNTRHVRTRLQLNFRNHRKLVLCDNHTAFVGGHNLGDEYLGDGQNAMNWRDTQVQIQGPAALGFQFIFGEDWHWATGKIPDLLWEVAPSVGQSEVMCIASGPADDTESASLYFTHLIHSAQKRCWLVSPYFVPDHNLYSALQLAGLRGVDVRILVPGLSDNRLVQHAMHSYIASLSQCQIQFFTYQKGFLHQKVFLIDDHWCSIGSANMDNRSLRINFEMNALINDKNFAQKAETMLLEDFKNAKPTTLSRHWWPVFLSKCARLFSPIL